SATMAHDDFVRAIIENPDDDGPRLVFADWLEEHGQLERAEFIRVQIELARLQKEDERRAGLETREKMLLEKNTRRWFGDRLKEFLEQPLQHDHDVEVRQRASKYPALPLMFDMGGFFALRMDGNVICFAWDEDAILRIEAELRLRYVAIFEGAKKYPEL